MEALGDRGWGGFAIECSSGRAAHQHLHAQGLCSRQISRASDGLAPLLDTYFNSYTAETRSMGNNALLSDPPNEQRLAAAGTARCLQTGFRRAGRGPGNIAPSRVRIRRPSVVNEES